MSKRGLSKAPLSSEDAAASPEAPSEPPISSTDMREFIASNLKALEDIKTSFNATLSASLGEVRIRLDRQDAACVDFQRDVDSTKATLAENVGAISYLASRTNADGAAIESNRVAIEGIESRVVLLEADPTARGTSSDGAKSSELAVRVDGLEAVQTSNQDECRVAMNNLEGDLATRIETIEDEFKARWAAKDIDWHLRLEGLLASVDVRLATIDERVKTGTAAGITAYLSATPVTLAPIVPFGLAGFQLQHHTTFPSSEASGLDINEKLRRRLPPGSILKFSDGDASKAATVTGFLSIVEQFCLQRGALPADIGQYVEQSARIRIQNFAGLSPSGLSIPLPTSSQDWVLLLQGFVDRFGGFVVDALRNVAAYANQIGPTAVVSIDLVKYGLNTVANDIAVAVRSCSTKDREESATRNSVVKTYINALPRELANIVCTKLQVVRQAAGDFLVPPSVTWLSLLTCITEEAQRMATDPMLSPTARSDFLRLEAKPQQRPSPSITTEQYRGSKQVPWKAPVATPVRANAGAGVPQAEAAGKAEQQRGCWNCHDTTHGMTACPKRCQFDASERGCNRGLKCGLAKTHKNPKSASK